MNSRKNKLDSLLASWPMASRSDVEWDEIAAQITKAAAVGTEHSSRANVMSDDDLFAPPLAREPEEDHPSAEFGNDSAGEPKTRPLVNAAAVENKKMSSPPSERVRDRSSFQDLAKLASSAPRSVPASSRAAVTTDDDSGVIDLQAIGAADPNAAERAKTTTLAAESLFDESVSEQPRISQPPSSVRSLRISEPKITELPSEPPTEAVPSSDRISEVGLVAGTNVPVAAEAIAAPVPEKKNEKDEKKGGSIFMFGGIAVAAAIAAGAFFMLRTSNSNAPSHAVTAVAPITKPVVAQPTATVAVNDAPVSNPGVDLGTLPQNNGSVTKPTSPGVSKKPIANGEAPAAANTVDPKLVFNMPQTSAGGSGGDLDEEMRKRVGASKEQQLAAAATSPTGNVPQKPSQGQVAGATNVVLPAARACLSADDPITKANVVFQSDGSVQSVSVSGFAAGKPSEACVKAALMGAKVPPFAEPTYTAPLTIHGTN